MCVWWMNEFSLFRPHFRWGPGFKSLGTNFHSFEANWILELDPWACILVLQIMSSHLSCFFWGPNQFDFPSKMEPCSFSLDLPLLVLDPHLKAVGPIYGSNLWLSSNRIGLFHWTCNLDSHLKWPLGFYVGGWPMFLKYMWWSNQLLLVFF